MINPDDPVKITFGDHKFEVMAHDFGYEFPVYRTPPDDVLDITKPVSFSCVIETGTLNLPEFWVEGLIPGNCIECDGKQYYIIHVAKVDDRVIVTCHCQSEDGSFIYKNQEEE